MKIFLTTLGRADNQVTLLNLPEVLQRQVIMVVQAHEYKAHVGLWGGRVAEVRCLDPAIRTLGPTRDQVFAWAREESSDHKVVMLDDDLFFYRRVSPTAWNLRNATGADVLEMFDWIEDSLDTYMHVGISGREGNNRVEDYSVETTRYMRVLAYRTDMPRGVVHGRVSGMSDFDVNLQLLRLGRPSLVAYHWAQGHKSTQTPGGCSINRTHETHDAEIDQMVEWHGPLVRVRQKENKTGGEFGSRRELTIGWKKALGAG